MRRSSSLEAAVAGPPDEAGLNERSETDLARVLEDFGPALRRVAAAYEAVGSRREDLVQEMAVALWQALPRFRGESSLRTFVFRVAHNRGTTWAQRSRTRREREAPEREVVDPRPGVEHDVMARQRSERLRAAIRGLPLPQRQVLTLALEELPVAEIGEVLGITENAAAVRLTRARRALRECLEGRV